MGLEAYLHDPNSYADAGGRSIKEKLEDVLKRFEIDLDLSVCVLENV